MTTYPAKDNGLLLVLIKFLVFFQKENGEPYMSISSLLSPSGLMEVPAYLLSFVGLYSPLGRKWTTSGSLLIAGIFMACMLAVPPGKHAFLPVTILHKCNAYILVLQLGKD